MIRSLKLTQHWCPHEQFFKDYKQRTVRCTKCSKRVITKPVFCIGGELVGHMIPPHKTKPKPTKRAKGDRAGARGRRG